MRLRPADSRMGAMAVSIALLASIYVLLIHIPFVAPLTRIADDMDALRDDRARYAHVVASRPLLQKQLQAQAAHDSASGAFLAQDDTNAAAADLMQRMVDLVGNQAKSGPCEVVQKMPVPVQAKPGEPYRKVVVNMTLRCFIEPLTAVLHGIATSRPSLFVEDFNVGRTPMAKPADVDAPLDVQFSVAGYLRPAPAPAPAPAHEAVRR
ncbi:general secretion pathway protein M [Luteibacter rhizovicinus]|uniref:General secretion pathway protein M n=1 Tax=Luteibacter rhizovicinus TaxID=242606 RepID=A0A4R3YJ77_9GAMM|nr:type II secretion system protein GspM [Luteibacter rhizovicinus]TCV91054.1 general secretion pathway protein M [Luteibacter rhizovicinus]